MKDDIPKIRLKVLLLRDTYEWQTATVHRLVGKATGKYCEWNNNEYEEGHILSTDCRKDVQSWYTEGCDKGEHSVSKLSENEDLEEGTEVIDYLNGLP